MFLRRRPQARRISIYRNNFGCDSGTDKVPMGRCPDRAPKTTRVSQGGSRRSSAWVDRASPIGMSAPGTFGPFWQLVTLADIGVRVEIGQSVQNDAIDAKPTSARLRQRAHRSAKSDHARSLSAGSSEVATKEGGKTTRARHVQFCRWSKGPGEPHGPRCFGAAVRR